MSAALDRFRQIRLEALIKLVIFIHIGVIRVMKFCNGQGKYNKILKGFLKAYRKF